MVLFNLMVAKEILQITYEQNGCIGWVPRVRVGVCDATCGACVVL
jgi:hypothetical protein